MEVFSTGTEPNGHDTVVFATSQPSVIVPRILKALAERWKDYIIDVELDDRKSKFKFTTLNWDIIDQWDDFSHIILYIVKNGRMAQLFRERGYELANNREGPLAFHLRRRSNVLFRVDELTEVRRGDDEFGIMDPYKAWVCSDCLLELTAVTPADPASDEFSKWAVELLIHACLAL